MARVHSCRNKGEKKNKKRCSSSKEPCRLLRAGCCLQYSSALCVEYLTFLVYYKTTLPSSTMICISVVHYLITPALSQGNWILLVSVRIQGNMKPGTTDYMPIVGVA